MNEAMKWFLTGELPQSESKDTYSIVTEADGVLFFLRMEKARKTEVGPGIACKGLCQAGKNSYSTEYKSVYAGLADNNSLSRK
jgi:hypothetical protein